MRFILLLAFLMTRAFAQVIGFDPIDAKDLRPWKANVAEYAGLYRFGDSEDECDLLLIVTDSGIVAQIRSGAFTEGGTAWINQWRNVSGGQIGPDGSFVAESFRGVFVEYLGNGISCKGLKIKQQWAFRPAGDDEVGLRTGPATVAGAWPQASTRLLTVRELQEVPKETLRRMRNEIYARYGFRFRAGGEMDVYFRQQSWYQPQHTEVTAFLTWLEQRNLKRIAAAEAGN